MIIWINAEKAGNFLTLIKDIYENFTANLKIQNMQRCLL